MDFAEFGAGKLNFNIPKKRSDQNDKSSDNEEVTPEFYKKHEENFYGYVGEEQKDVYGPQTSPRFDKKEKKTRENQKRIRVTEEEMLKSDDSLPSELRNMFEPMTCKLCNAQLTSTIDARIHYKSNSHDKKIRNWLIKYSETTGEPLHKKAMIQETKEEDKDPKYFHCTVCDLPLSGKLHAESHYIGKNHLRALKGHSPPKRKNASNENMFCDICKVKGTSAIQFKAHLQGQKHLKKVKMLNVQQTSLTMPEEEAPQPLQISDDDLRCGLCDIVVNSKNQMTEHLKSKKHLVKLIQ